MGVGGSEDGEENKDPKFIAFQEENKKLWKLKDELSRMQNKVLKEMLELNDQNPKGGEADLAERCAYGMLFGALPRCPRTGCKDNFLKYSVRCSCSTSNIFRTVNIVALEKMSGLDAVMKQN
jgi:hypothetical protein